MTLVKTSTGGLVGMGSSGGTLKHTEHISDTVCYQRAVLVQDQVRSDVGYNGGTWYLQNMNMNSQHT